MLRKYYYEWNVHLQRKGWGLFNAVCR